MELARNCPWALPHRNSRGVQWVPVAQPHYPPEAVPRLKSAAAVDLPCLWAQGISDVAFRFRSDSRERRLLVSRSSSCTRHENSSNWTSQDRESANLEGTE